MLDFLIGYTRGSNIKGIIELRENQAEEMKGRWCLYEGEMGQDLAKIIGGKKEREGALVAKKMLGRFVRLINNDDVERIKRLKKFELEAKKSCENLIEKHGLPMRIIRTILSFDEKRLTFYFIANERVDFRSLVKDLVSLFHKMIRLQQIGPRDHARIVNGVGLCGRQLCCAEFLGEVGKITKDTAMAQGMESLNSDKISGACGKLMCCLRYELDEYDNANIKSKNTNIK